MWRALALRRAWRAARAAHGEFTTVAIAKMLELAALDPTLAQIVSVCRVLMFMPREMETSRGVLAVFGRMACSIGVTCKVISLCDERFAYTTDSFVCHATSS